MHEMKKKSSEILLEAQKLMIETGIPYVCHAISMVGNRNPEAKEKCQDIVEKIGSSIAPFNTVILWLWENHRDFHIQNPQEVTKSGFYKNYRLAWIDWMIEGYKAIGD